MKELLKNKPLLIGVAGAALVGAFFLFNRSSVPTASENDSEAQANEDYGLMATGPTMYNAGGMYTGYSNDANASADVQSAIQAALAQIDAEAAASASSLGAAMFASLPDALKANNASGVVGSFTVNGLPTTIDYHLVSNAVPQSTPGNLALGQGGYGNFTFVDDAGITRTVKGNIVGGTIAGANVQGVTVAQANLPQSAPVVPNQTPTTNPIVSPTPVPYITPTKAVTAIKRYGDR